MKFQYRSLNFPTGYASKITCEKFRGREGCPYFVSVGSGIHFFAVCDDFGNLIFV